MLHPATRARLRSQHDALRYHLQGFSDEEIHVQSIVEGQPAKWSAAQNVAHLGSYQELVVRVRIPGIVNNTLTSFARFTPDTDESFLAWCTLPVSEMLTRLDATRQDFIELAEDLSPHDLAQTAHHARYGTMNVEQWIEFFLLHEAHHIFTVFRRVRGLV